MKISVYVFLILSSFVLSQQTEPLERVQEKYLLKNHNTKSALKLLEDQGFRFNEALRNKVLFINELGMPVFSELLNEKSGINSNVNQIWSYNFNGNTYSLTGNNMTVYVWDGGSVRDSHQELAGRVTNMDLVGISNHSTVVAGAIAASGVVSDAKGMAPEAAIIARDFQDRDIEIPLQIDAKLSNHSYGIISGWIFRSNSPFGNDPGEGWYFVSDYNVSQNEPNFMGNYLESTVFWDEVAYAMPEHIIVKAAGNSQGKGPDPGETAFYFDGESWLEITGTLPAKNCANGYDCLIEESSAKNIVVVGAINHLTTTDNLYHTPEDVVLTGFSSCGPRDDGGIKPDVVAVGGNVYSSRGSSDTSYSETNGQGWANGTSFSAPMVTGIMTLWNQLYLLENNSYLPSDLAKALLCHTTMESGPSIGPDYQYGWGLIDAKKGVETLLQNNVNTFVQEENLINGSTYTYSVTASGIEPLKATISWLDPAAAPILNSINDRTSRLVNDLDLKIVKTSDNATTLPWKLDPDNPSAAATKGDNTVDNVEQVLIENPEAGATYEIQVSHKGNLIDDTGANSLSTQFGLVVSGIDIEMSVTDIDAPFENVSIYPNPVQEFLYFRNLEDIDLSDIVIYDYSGQLISRHSSINHNSLNMSQLPRGEYVIVLKTKDSFKSFSILKE